MRGGPEGDRQRGPQAITDQAGRDAHHASAVTSVASHSDGNLA